MAEQMTNQVRNKIFLNAVDPQVKNDILASIANHYGTDTDTIWEELTDNDEAEHLLDYMVDYKNNNIRSATSLLMEQSGIRGF